MCLPYQCSVNDMLAIDLNAWVEYTINNSVFKVRSGLLPQFWGNQTKTAQDQSKTSSQPIQSNMYED